MHKYIRQITNYRKSHGYKFMGGLEIKYIKDRNKGITLEKLNNDKKININK